MKTVHAALVAASARKVLIDSIRFAVQDLQVPRVCKRVTILVVLLTHRAWKSKRVTILVVTRSWQ
jgi:azurin